MICVIINSTISIQSAQTSVLGLLAWAMCIYSSSFYLPLRLLISFKPALGWLLFSCFTCIFATFDVLPVFFHGFGTPVFLPHIFHVLASCSSILLVLFLAFIFVHFYLVKCTFLQNIVNYDAWHTFGPLPLAGAALESCFDVLTVFFHGFGTPTFLPRVFHVLASCCSILLVLFLVFIFVHFFLVKCTF